MSAYDIHPGIKISCKCDDDVKNVSMVDAVKAAISGCDDCNDDHLISVKFTKGAKK